MTTLREADTNTVTGATRDEKLLAAIGKYNQGLLRAGSSPAVAPGPPGSQRARKSASGGRATGGRPFLWFL